MQGQNKQEHKPKEQKQLLMSQKTTIQSQIQIQWMLTLQQLIQTLIKRLYQQRQKYYHTHQKQLSTNSPYLLNPIKQNNTNEALSNYRATTPYIQCIQLDYLLDAYKPLTIIDKQKVQQTQINLSLVFSYYTFTNLKKLTFEYMQLDSVEFLSFMDLPLLEQLKLDNNPIFMLRSIVKSNLPLLQLLSVQQCYIKEYNLLQRTRLCSIKRIVIIQSSGYQYVVNPDSSFCAKLDIRSLIQKQKQNRVQIKCNRRVQSQKKSECLKSKGVKFVSYPFVVKYSTSYLYHK